MRMLFFFEVHGSAIAEGDGGQEVLRNGLLPRFVSREDRSPPKQSCDFLF
jgi:hypothetical protein